jgi:hypothetical protein
MCQRRVLYVVPRVHIAAGREQHLDDLGAALLRGQVQRRVAALFLGLLFRARGQQVAQALGVAK